MRIQCPDCSQRFDVTDEFLGKTVECGSCDGRFKVTKDDVLMEKEKFYPGEKRGSHLERFGRGSGDTAAPVAFQQAHYQADVNADSIGPPRPRRTAAAAVGISLMALVIIIFLLVGGKEGLMRDMVMTKRFILVGFTALLGSMLVIYGMVNRRGMALLLSLILGGALLLLPVFFPGNPTLASVQAVPQDSISAAVVEERVPSAEDAKEIYLLEIGYGPVASALEQHPEDTVVAIFLRNASESVRGKITDYLYEATDKLSHETTYNRGDDGSQCLILFQDQKKSIDEFAQLCDRFGRVEKISKDLRVIDVMVEGGKLQELDMNKVLDSGSLDFELQNLKALKSIDPNERMSAVKRLAEAEPRALRDDITQQLIAMLPDGKTDMKLEVIRALKTWSLPTAGAEPVVLDAVKKIHLEGRVSKTAMEFLIARKVQGSESILLELWEKDPAAWEQMMIQLGEGVQLLLLPKMKVMDLAHLASAANIVGDTGTMDSVRYLEDVMKGMDGQEKKSLQAAIDEIKKRS